MASFHKLEAFFEEALQPTRDTSKRRPYRWQAQQLLAVPAGIQLLSWYRRPRLPELKGIVRPTASKDTQKPPSRLLPQRRSVSGTCRPIVSSFPAPCTYVKTLPDPSQATIDHRTGGVDACPANGDHLSRNNVGFGPEKDVAYRDVEGFKWARFVYGVWVWSC